ncbi:histone deacetylase [Polynucleobacter sp. 30F-ANTBAC]|uniref:histone deacetylase family protein n=1 Tax=Polynucleobacter sp. 30F-ANTBAC TaxID=2689095 RepID=UPI001C0B64F4|nr:histone deacetylase [Polynucleobacter sp. 30F-ANTBAC]MBU3599164.1 histone deacetylase [Polynucleobacter sp. 30F-ANTBAC]
MQKYRLLRDRVSKIDGIHLIEPSGASDEDLLRVHTSDYVRAVTMGLLEGSQIREIGFPWSEMMVERSRRSAGATIQACLAALQEGVSVNLAGGTHHAYADKGSGFCVFNDAAIATKYVQALQPNMPVAIIDLDVHQGNGTAAILGKESSCFTLSLHGEKNFPFRKESSHLDIGLEDGLGDQDYLQTLHRALESLEAQFNPELIIYLAGADPHEGDRLGRLKLSMSGMAKRDSMVLSFAKEHRCPIALAMAGGYGTTIETTVDVHEQTIQLAFQHFLQKAH